VSDQQAAARDTWPDSDLEAQERLAHLVNSFIAMMKDGNMARLDLEYRELRLSLRAHGEQPLAAATPVRIDVPVTSGTSPSTQDGTSDELHTVTAPMIGTFYAAPAPSEPPFVRPGDHVEEGQTIGIIEAMKIMNEIAADRSGTVVEIVAQNAQSVEYGSPLVRLSPDAA
jgi:acetyl-CoA carboxylase biotin carboxyl carrier protein